MSFIRTYALAGALIFSAAGLGSSTASAGPLAFAPASAVSLDAPLALARYVPKARHVVVRHSVRRHVIRRRYVRRRYGPGPAFALGLFGAALGALTAPDYYYYDYPGYYYGPSYYYGPGYSSYGGYRRGGFYRDRRIGGVGVAHFAGGGFRGGGFHGGGFHGGGFHGGGRGGGHGHR